MDTLTNPLHDPRHAIEERFRLLADASPNGLIIVDHLGRIVLANRLAEIQFGYPSGVLAGQSVDILVPERFRQIHPAHRDMFVADPQARLMGMGRDLFGQRQDGSEFPVEIGLNPFEIPEGRFIFASIVDITERKQAEQALVRYRDHLKNLVQERTLELKASEERFRRLAENAQDLIYRYTFTPVRGFEYVSPAATLMTGYTPEEHYADPDLGLKLVHPDDRPKLAAAAQGKLRPGEPLVVRWVRRDGQTIWTEQLNVPVMDDAGNLIAIEGIARDITDRMRAEAALRSSEERFRRYFELGLIGMAMTSPDKGILEVNDHLCAMLGYERNELLQMTWAGWTHPEDLADDVAQFNRVMAGEIDGYSLDKRCIRKDGRVIYATISVKCLRRADGAVDYFIALLQDITERKQSETALTDANKRLSQLLGEMEQHSRDLATINKLNDFLQICQNTAEAYTVIAQFMPQLFPTDTGALYAHNASRDLIERVASWGELAEDITSQAFLPNECWALRRSHLYEVENSQSEVLCQHVRLDRRLTSFSYLCATIKAQGEVLGVLHLRRQLSDARDTVLVLPSKKVRSSGSEAKQALVTNVAEQLSLALVNLKLRETLSSQSIRDPLTNLFNRRYMEESLERELRRAKRQTKPLSIIIIDIDYFKSYNDRFGHEAGDMILQSIARLLQERTRGEDIICRWGGEEFMLILPEMLLEVAVQRAEALREAAPGLQVQYRGQVLKNITLSIGVASFPKHGQQGSEVIRAADTALYQAKETGRNRIVLAE